MDEINSSIMKLNLFTLGNSNVGKTCFIYKYVHNKFKSQYTSTIGYDFLSKNIILPSGQNIKLVFYDTAGQERFKSMSMNLLKNADGILLLYDITSIETFNAIKGWVESIIEIKGNNFPIVLIGNKCDLEEKRKITKDEGEKEAENNGFLFFETSCKDNINIEESINAIVSMIANEKSQIQYDKNESQVLEKKKIKKQKKKCNC